MSEGIKIPLAEARTIGHHLIIDLAGHVKEAMIVGSVRREKEFVGDIEICCLPLPFETGIFESGFAKVVNQWTKVKGEPDGKYTQRILPSGLKLDLFMPDDFDYFRQVAIRTGSADYSFKVIAQGWINKGWCGSDKGLRKQLDCTKKGDKWICFNPDAEKPPHWTSEREFFDWLGVKYLEPKFRI